MNHRFFTICFFVIFCMFIGLNSIIWLTWTKDITSPLRKGGDLLRLGYIHGFVAPRPQPHNLSRLHIEVKDFTLKRVDMVTVGDSFSVGKSGCYQDHLASSLNISILNCGMLASSMPLNAPGKTSELLIWLGKSLRPVAIT